VAYPAKIIYRHNRAVKTDRPCDAKFFDSKAATAHEALVAILVSYKPAAQLSVVNLENNQKH